MGYDPGVMATSAGPRALPRRIRINPGGDDFNIIMVLLIKPNLKCIIA